jgi:hypothetical protein
LWSKPPIFVSVLSLWNLLSSIAFPTRINEHESGDLARYFGGAVDLATITVHTVEHDDVPGRLRAQRFDESVIPPENRIPRLTSASWQYQSGAVGSLMHVVALHGM